MGLLKPRTTSVILYQGDDLERLAELRRAVDRAETQPPGPRRGGDEIPGAVEREALEAFAGEAAERAVEIRLQAIGSTRFAALMLAHEPRRVDGPDDGKRMHEDDEPFGVNTLTFGKALLSYRDEDRAEVRTILEPDLSPEDLREFLDDDCADGDIERLWTTAYYLNRSEASGDPKGAARSMSGFPS